MRRLAKWLVILGFAFGLLYGGSYLGARATLGKLIGSNTPGLGKLSARFVWGGVQSLQGKPRAWQFTYNRVAAVGGPAWVFVSPSGKLLATIPGDLNQRLEAAAKARDDAMSR